MWTVEKWGTKFLYRYFGIFKLYVSQSPVRPHRWTGHVIAGQGKGVAVTHRFHDNEMSAKYEALIELRNHLKKSLFEVEQALEETDGSEHDPT